MISAVLLRAPAAWGVAAGTLDPTFASGGELATNVDSAATGRAMNAMVLQPDGKVVVIGSPTLALMRFNIDGSLDPTFDGDGKVTDTPPFGAGGAVLQSDGKIIVVGGGAILRYNSDGSLDSSFGMAGLADMPGGGGPAAMQSDGKIVVAGSAQDPDAMYYATNTAVFRFNADGSLDNSFDGDGMAVVASGTSATAVAIQADGKIVTLATAFGGIWVIRFNADGSLDAGFGTGGIAAEYTGFGHANALALQPDDKVVVGGAIATGIGDETSHLAVVRYNANGTLDPSFDGDGTALTDFGGFVGALTLQGDGKVVAAGDCGAADGDHLCLIRFNPDGSLDAGFGDQGLVMTTDFQANDAVAVAWQSSDKKLVAAGHGGSGPPELRTEFAIARFLASCGDGVYDPAFEECDDGDTINGNGCDNNCTATACGNGIVTAGEQCDDGNAVNGDGCDSNCTVTGCGNGITTTGEECDDGNNLDGDGCSSICADTAGPETVTDPQLTAGETLTSDPESDGATPGDPVETSITMSVGTASATIAEASGQASAAPGYAFFGQQVQLTFNCPVGPCPSASAPLTIAFRIDASRVPGDVDETSFALFRDGALVPACTGAPGVADPDPCVSTRQRFNDGDIGATVLTSHASVWGFARGTCSPSALACDDPLGAVFQVKKAAGDPSATSLLWKWLHGTINSPSDFGDPLASTSYTLCIYDGPALVESHVLAPGGDCGGVPCWKALGKKGFGYKNPSGNGDGVTKLLLKSGAGKAKILVKGKGANLAVPESDPIYAQSSQLTVQLVASNGACWQAVYPNPANTSTGEKFKDKIP